MRGHGCASRRGSLAMESAWAAVTRRATAVAQRGWVALMDVGDRAGRVQEVGGAAVWPVVVGRR